MIWINIFGNFINIDELNEQCIIIVQLGNQIIQQISVPILFAVEQFKQLILQTKNDSRPIQIKCTRQEYTEEGKLLNNSLTFNNLSWIKNFENENENKMDNN